MNDMTRVSQLAFAASFVTDPNPGPVCPDGRCACPTCGVVRELLRGNLVSRGATRLDAQRVTVEASNLGSCSHPYLASVRVDGREVYRIETDPDEALDPSVMDDIERALGA